MDKLINLSKKIVKKTTSTVLSFLMIFSPIASNMSYVGAMEEPKIVSLDSDKDEILIDEVATINAITNLPDDYVATSYDWSIDNEEVAMISGEMGTATVTGLAVGKVKITVEVNYQKTVYVSDENGNISEQIDSQKATAEMELAVVDEYTETAEESAPIEVDEDKVVKAKKSAEVDSEAVEVSESEDNVLDPVTAQYIQDNIDSKYANFSKAELANLLLVKNTLIEADKAADNETIDSLFEREDTGEVLITTIQTSVALYNTDDNSDYYVGYANTMNTDKTAKLKDFCFAMNNNNGEVVESAVFDEDTGLAYIPKSLFKGDDGKEVLMNVQVQFLQAISQDVEDSTSKVEYVTTEKGEETKSGSGKVDSFDFETTVKTEKGLSTDEMIVSVNGVPTDNYSYNKETGNVTIPASSTGIQNVTVNVEEKSTVAKVMDDFLGISEASAVSLNDMGCAGTIDLPDGVGTGWSGDVTLYKAYASDWEQPTLPTYGLTTGDSALVSLIWNGGNFDYSLLEKHVNDMYLGLWLQGGVDTVTGQTHPGFWNWSADNVSGATSIDAWIRLQCTHVSNPAGNGDEWAEEAIRVRVLDISGDEIVLGFLTKEVNTQSGIAIAKFKIRPRTGDLEITKVSGNTSITDGNSCYSLQGAEYQLRDGSGNTVATLTTDANGYAKATGIKQGNYTLVETKASPGYALNTSSIPVTITANQTTTLNGVGPLVETPLNDPAVIQITKIDEETGGNETQGDASLAGAEFTINYYNGQYTRENLPSEPTRSWVIQSKQAPNGMFIAALSDEYLVSGDEFYRQDGVVTLPLGTLTIEETKAPEGYTLENATLTDTSGNTNSVSNGVFLTNIVQNGNIAFLQAGNYPTVADEVKKQQVEIYKQGVREDGVSTTVKGLNGATFTIKLKADVDEFGWDDAPVVEEVTTAADQEGKDGYAMTEYLPYGTYIMRETATPKGYLPADDVIFTIQQDQLHDEEVDHLHIVVNNEEIMRPVEIVKKDADTGEIITLNGATFQIRDLSTGELVTQKVGNSVYSTFTTNNENRVVADDSFISFQDEKGTVTTPLKLSSGKYQIEEIISPEGYLLNDEPVQFEISGDYLDYTNVDEEGLPVCVVEFSDTAIKGKITVYKQGEVLTGVTQDDLGNYDFTYTERYLAGATVQLVAREDIIDPVNGEVIFKAGEVVETKTTDENGQIVFDGSTNDKVVYDGLLLGEYYIQEIEAPEGYSLNSEKQNVSLTDEGNEEEFILKSTTVLNDRQKIRINVEKTDKDTGDYVSGATFVLRNKNDIVDADGNVLLPAGTVIETRVTNDGRITFQSDLPIGEYEVQETQAPAGYVTDSTVHSFDGNYKGQDITVQRYTARVEETPIKVRFAKVDAETGNDIGGAVLELRDSEGTLIDSWETNANQRHEIKYLHAGEEYTLTEVKAPNNYVINTEPVKFTVEDSAEVEVVSMSDQAVKGKITVEKRGEALVGTETADDGTIEFIYEERGLEGAVFEVIAKENIRHPDGKTGIIYNKGDLVATLTTGKDGTATTEELPLGEYSVREITAPNGYIHNGEVKHVALEYADQHTELVFDSAEFENDRQTIEDLTSIKTDADTGETLADAEFTVYNKEAIYAYDGTLLLNADTPIQTVKTGEDGKAVFTADLPLGQYYIAETKAPEGYHSTDVTADFDGSYQGQDVESVTGSVSFVNTETEVEISKQDVTTGVEVAGNILQLFDKDGNLVEEWVSKQGKSHIVKGLHTGEEYTLVEKLAATGYTKANDVKFTVIDYGDNPQVQKIVMYNDLVKGRISVEKRGEVLVGTSVNNGTIDFEYELRGIPGAVFEIYAKEDIKHPDNESEDFYKAGELVATLTTGEDGTATTGDLPLGNYIVKEVKAPEGFTINGEEQTASLTYADQLTPIVFDSTELTNDRQTVDVSALKRDKETDKVLAGAEFTIYADQDIYSYDGELLVADGTAIQTVTTGEDGFAKFTVDLPLAMYQVKETKAPDGYHSTALTYDFDATAKDQTVHEITAIYEFENTITDLEFTKKDITTEVETAGNILQVFDSNGTLIEEWTSELNTEHHIKGLHIGETYTLVEKLAANGYLKADSIEFTVVDMGDGATVQTVDTMYDELVKGELIVEKRGEALTGTTTDEDGNTIFTWEERGLEGATFNVYAREDIKHPDGVTENFYNEGDFIATLVTDHSGTAKLSDLPLGKYRVEEVIPPEGYLDNENNVTDVELSYKDQFTAVVRSTATFNNDRQTVDLTGVKKDSNTGETVEGAEFTLYAAENILDYDGNILVEAGEKIETVTTDETGYCSFQATLPLGKYTIKETKAPVGYNSTAKVIDVDVSYQGPDVDTVEFEAEFVNIPTKVKLSKQDITTQVETAGNYLQVFDSKGNLVDEWVSELDTPHYIEYLHVGETYTMVERLAATGYLKAEDIQFTVVDNGDSGAVQEIVPMYDELVHGRISVEKQGDVLTGIETNDDGSISFVYEERGLAGAVYEVYAREDIVHPDGKSDNFYNAGDLVATITTGEDGKAVTEDLPLGSYYVKEVTAPDGFVINGEPQNADLVYEDQYTELVFDGLSFTNDKQDVEIKVIKQDSETDTFLKGAEFALIAAKDILDVDGNVLVTAGTEIERVTTDETGTAVFKADLPLGHYDVIETKPPIGYASTDAVVHVDATYKGQTISLVSTEAGFKNDMTEFDISKKSITTAEELPGATLAIYPADENGEPILGECFETWVSTNVPHKIKGLEVGKKYVLVETSAPFDDGYVTSKSINFVVEDTGEVQKVEMIDDVTKVEITKTDITTGEPVIGAQLSIIPVNEDGTLDEGATFDTWITGEEPHYIQQLPVGKYVLREVLGQASEYGYVTANDVEFEVLDTGEIQKVDMDDDYTTTEFSKVDTEGEAVEGAVMAIVPLDDEGNPLYGETFDTWMTMADDPETEDVDESIHVVEYLPIGKYQLVELTAPDGYVKALPVEFEVKDTAEVQQFFMVEKQVAFTKTDVTGEEEIPGAHIEVKDENGNTVDEWVSTDESHPISGLEEGKEYTLIEVVAPDEYVKAEEITFVVDTEKTDQHVEMQDKQVFITKTDITNGEEIPGAELTVTDKETGEIVDQWTSTTEAHPVSGLEEGKTYILIEVQAPNGYEIAESIEFEVSYDKVIQHIEMMDAPYTTIQVNKVDSATKQAIVSKDFEFTMYADEACTQVIKTVNANQTDGTATFEQVGFGTYFIKETKAPVGYLLSDEVKKIVVDQNLEGVGGIHSFVYENTLEPVSVNVNTGDNANMVPFVIAGGVALVAGAGIIISKKRKKETNQDNI